MIDPAELSFLHERRNLSMRIAHISESKFPICLPVVDLQFILGTVKFSNDGEENDRF